MTRGIYKTDFMDGPSRSVHIQPPKTTIELICDPEVKDPFKSIANRDQYGHFLFREELLKMRDQEPFVVADRHGLYEFRGSKVEDRQHGRIIKNALVLLYEYQKVPPFA